MTDQSHCDDSPQEERKAKPTNVIRPFRSGRDGDGGHRRFRLLLVLSHVFPYLFVLVVTRHLACPQTIEHER